MQEKWKELQVILEEMKTIKKREYLSDAGGVRAFRTGSWYAGFAEKTGYGRQQ